MATIAIYNFAKQSKATLEVNDAVFAIKPHTSVMHQAMEVMRKNQHAGLAHTKRRGEVRGGGRKPWKQKGTGRARTSSIRTPLWVGGGIAFGPRKHEITASMPEKMKQLALKSGLSARATEQKLWAYEELNLSVPKTKEALIALAQLPEYKKLLIVSDQQNEALKKALSNVPSITFLEKSFPNIIDILHHDCILLEKTLIDRLTKTFVGEKKVSKKANVKAVKEGK